MIPCLTVAYRNPEAIELLQFSIDRCNRYNPEPVELRIHDNSENNIGLTKAINLLLARVESKYAVWCGQDVRFFPHAIANAVDFMDAHPFAACAGMKQLDPEDPDRITHGGTGAFFPSGEHLIGRVGAGDHNESKQFKWVNFASVIIRMEAYRQIGPFDERYFLLAQDADWCLRAWQAGWQVYYCAEAVVLHGSDGVAKNPSPEQMLICHRDMDLFTEKWAVPLANNPACLGQVTSNPSA